MKAIVRGRETLLPDPSPQAGRVVVRVSTSARRVEADTPQRRRSSTLAMLRERAVRAPEILRHDGFSILFSKTLHAVRRETQRHDVMAASFVGHVVDWGSTGDDAAPNTRVAGASLTYPPDTEYVVARPETVFRVGESDEDAAALALYGGIAVYVVDEAARMTDGVIGVSGDGVLAQLAASLVAVDGRSVARRTAAATPGATAGTRPADVWIETSALSPPCADAVAVLGLAVGQDALKRIWPRADVRIAADAGDALRGGSHILDLYYDQGEPEWPPWLEPRLIERYLRFVSDGVISLGALPPPLEIASASAAGTSERPLSPAGASNSGIVFTRFPSDPARALKPRQDLPRPPHREKAEKRVSVVGAGEWPLGMILRQIVRDERIVLRGACDRRPEILHLAGRALPFQFLTTRYADLLDDDATDMIVVAPYHGAHAPLAVEALQSGKHCFVEKPPAVDHGQLSSLLSAAAGSDRMLHVGYNRRYAPATELLLRHLECEEGPLTIDIVVHGIPLPRNHWYFWPSNGNRIISNTCHFIDYALSLAAPALPVNVTASPTLVGRMDEDVVVAITFDDGSLASVTYTQRGSDRRAIYYQSYRVMRGEMTAEIEDFARLTIHRGGRRVATWRGAPDLGHRRQMAIVADALVMGGPAPTKLEMIAVSARTVLAAAESASSGNSVTVAVPPSSSGMRLAR